MINWSVAPKWAQYAAVNRRGDVVWISSKDLRVVNNISKREDNGTPPPNKDESVVIDARVDFSNSHRLGSKFGAIAKHVNLMGEGDQIRVSKIIDKDGKEGTQKQDQVLLHRFLMDRGVYRVQYYEGDLVITCLSTS